jgi:hypothetical protein
LVQPATPNIQSILTSQQEFSLDAAACHVAHISEVIPQPALSSIGPTPKNTALLQEIEDVKYFCHMLEARHFTIFTDHKPIIYSFQQKQDKCSPWQFNHLDFVASS